MGTNQAGSGGERMTSGADGTSVKVTLRCGCNLTGRAGEGFKTTAGLSALQRSKLAEPQVMWLKPRLYFSNFHPLAISQTIPGSPWLTFLVDRIIRGSRVRGEQWKQL